MFKSSPLLRTCFALLFALVFSPALFATWSIAILDPVTRTIGVAGASCTFNVVGVCKVITGKGVFVAQAYSDDQFAIKGLDMIRRGAPTDSILAAVTDRTVDREVAFRQYGIVTFADYEHPRTFTGDSIAASPFAATESCPGITVQGNTLADKRVVTEVFNAVKKGKEQGMSMEDLLILALEIGSRYGGDRRCGEQVATTAFIQIVRPADTYCSYLDLHTAGIKKGGPNATTVIRKELNRIRKEFPANKCTELGIYPKD